MLLSSMRQLVRTSKVELDVEKLREEFALARPKPPPRAPKKRQPPKPRIFISPPLPARCLPPPPPPPGTHEAYVQSLQNAYGTRALLLEIIRRAASDWVLYRTSRRMKRKELAEEAYTWLFLEKPGHPDWELRKREDKEGTSFLFICDALDLNPEQLRMHIRKLTPHNVMNVGRPAEYRRRGELAGSAARALPPADDERSDNE
jgi:hypothetical protein